MKNKANVQAHIEAALKHEYTDVQAFVRALASYSTLENMGQLTVAEFARHASWKPERLFAIAYGSFAGEAELDGESVDDEYNEWAAHAQKIAVTLQKKKMPLTVENGNHAWLKTGPFAKKA